MALRVAGKQITTIVSDLDGTLLEPGAQALRPEVLANIETLVNSGITFIAASGRQYSNIRRLFGEGHDWDLGLWKKIAYNCENGAVVAWDGEIKLQIPIEPELMDEILADMEDFLAADEELKGDQNIVGRPGPYYVNEPAGMEILTSSATTCYVSPRDMTFYDMIATTIGNQTKVVEDFRKVEEPIDKVSMHFPGGVPVKVSQFFHKKYDGKVLVFEAGNGWLDIVPLSCGKGSALQFMAENMGFSLEETMTFGDSENDISMLAVSGLSICMEPSTSLVKEAAMATCKDVNIILRQGVQQVTIETLRHFVESLCEKAEKKPEYAEGLWSKISKSSGVLRELAYFHDTGDFLGEMKVAGYSITDILVWQVDHFKAYMDRHNDMNRYRRERLFLESLEVLADMEVDPDFYARKMTEESGTDFDQKY